MVERKTAFTAARMGDESNSTTTMYRVNHLRHIDSSRAITCISQDTHRACSISSVTMSLQQDRIFIGIDQFSATLSKDLLQMWELIPFTDEIVINLISNL